MTPYYADDWLTVYLGDCRGVLAKLPADSVHCVITSPPYYGLRDYGEPGQIGLEPTPEQYVAELVAVFREVRRVLRPDGTVWLNLGDSYATGAGKVGERPGGGTQGDGWQGPMTSPNRMPLHGFKPKDRMMIPARVALALKADGWWLRDEIVWAKPNPMPSSVTDRTTPAHEMVYLLTKRARYWYDAVAVREGYSDKTEWTYPQPDKAARSGVTTNGTGASTLRVRGEAGRNKRSVWTIATQPYPEAHFATFPEALVEPMILAGCPERTCAECGAGWERVVEREVDFTSGSGRSGKPPAGKNGRAYEQAVSGEYDIRMGPSVRSTTIGWQPTCSHDAPTIPGTVLDPFAGSGTVGLVAQRHSRRAILIDLSAEYMKQLLLRNAQTPMGLAL